MKAYASVISTGYQQQNYSVHKHNTNKVITTKSKVNIRDIINREQSLATNTENPADEQVCVELLGIF